MDETLNTVNEVQEQNVDAQPTEQVTETVINEQAEVVTPQQDTKPVQSAEENANYAKIRREAETKARQKARDEWIAEQQYEWNGKPIKTEAEYQQALQEKEMQDRGIDPTEVRKIAEDLPEVKEARQYKRDREQFQEFAKEFPGINLDQIPTEVLEQYAKGKDLTDAYARWKVRDIAATETKAKAEAEKAKANETNAKASMGSVSTDGETPEGFISQEAFNAKRNDRQWIIKNLSKITASRTKW
jgi:hypothetical protein